MCLYSITAGRFSRRASGCGRTNVVVVVNVDIASSLFVVVDDDVDDEG